MEKIDQEIIRGTDPKSIAGTALVISCKDIRQIRLSVLHSKQGDSDIERAYKVLNDYAFTKSIELLNKGHAVLIFIEGICINSNELQPFKKGTARILEGIQKLNTYPKIHIAGIAFNQFRGIGKIVNLVVTEMTTIPKIENSRDRVLFNKLVFDQLKQNILIPTTPTMFNKNNLIYQHLIK
jgi:hypothetical protein